MPRRVSRAALTDSLLRDLKRLVLSLRGRFFTRSKPPESSIVVPMDVSGVRRLLGEAHFAPNWDMSFAYFGEVVNLRRVEYVADHPSGYEWWQVHVRGYHHPDGLELTAHFETDPSESPDAHVDRVGIDIQRGLDELTALLDSEGIEHASLSPTPEEAAPTRG